MNNFGNSAYVGLKCIGYQPLVVGLVASTLTIPNNSSSAVLVLEANAATVPNSVAARFLESGASPTPLVGMPLVNLSIYEIRAGDLATFQIISANGLIHTAHIEYFA